MNPQLLEKLFEQLPDSIYLLDPLTSNILYCNRLGYQSLQMAEEEVLHHSVLSLKKPQWALPMGT